MAELPAAAGPPKAFNPEPEAVLPEASEAPKVLKPELPKAGDPLIVELTSGEDVEMGTAAPVRAEEPEKPKPASEPPSNGDRADAPSAPTAPPAAKEVPKAKEVVSEAPKQAAKPKEVVPEIPKPYKLLADSAVMQGHKAKQEDRHVKVPDLTKAAKALKMPIDHLEQPCSFFAVYDGHQGTLCSEFVAKGFHGKLLKKLSANTEKAFWTEERIKTALSEVLEELDADFLAKYRTAPDGCTVVVTFLSGTRLFTAWVGGTRCLLCNRVPDEEVDVRCLTEDHRPGLDAEADRVKQAGGVIVDFGFGNLRVAHPGYDEKMREMRRAQSLGLGAIGKEPVALAVTRTLGDREFKAVTGRALLIPTPGVVCTTLTRRDHCFVLVCDGIADVMSAEDVIDELQLHADVRTACGALVSEAYKKGSQDNLTVILVRLDWTGNQQPMSGWRVKREIAEVVTETKSEVSKRRRLDASAAITKQKVTAYERAVAAEEEVERVKADEVADRKIAQAAIAAELESKAAVASKVAESKTLATTSVPPPSQPKAESTSNDKTEKSEPAANADAAKTTGGAEEEEEEEEFFL